VSCCSSFVEPKRQNDIREYDGGGTRSGDGLGGLYLDDPIADDRFCLFCFWVLCFFSRKEQHLSVNDTQNLIMYAVDAEREPSTGNTRLAPNAVIQVRKCAHMSGARRPNAERRLELGG